MPTFSELREMYDRGQIEAVLTEIEKNPVSPGNEGADDLTTLKGWCHYRRKEFDQAHQCSLAAGSHQWARELMAYLHAYVTQFKNDQALLKIADELGASNVNIANAFVIRARAADCNLLTHEQVANLVDKFKNERSVHAANLFHNGGRFFLAKPRDNKDFKRAIHYLNDAIDRYGMKTNIHHRAAAFFWKSQAIEKWGNMPQAIDAAQESVRLWNEQCALAPENKAFAQSSENAKKRLDELTTKA